MGTMDFSMGNDTLSWVSLSLISLYLPIGVAFCNVLVLMSTPAIVAMERKVSCSTQEPAMASTDGEERQPLLAGERRNNSGWFSQCCLWNSRGKEGRIVSAASKAFFSGPMNS